MVYALEKEPEMLIKTQLLFVYFKVLEESHFTLKKKKTKKKTKQNTKLKTVSWNQVTTRWKG